MRELLGKALKVAFTSPFTLAMWAWTALMIAASVAMSLGVPMAFWELGKDVLGRDLVMKDALMVLLYVVFFLAGGAFIYYVTWVSASVTWSATRALGREVVGVVDSTREVLATQAEEAERIDAQAGQISLSVGDGAGGRLSEASPGDDGLELVREASDEADGVALDLNEGAVAAVEDREQGRHA